MKRQDYSVLTAAEEILVADPPRWPPHPSVRSRDIHLTGSPLSLIITLLFWIFCFSVLVSHAIKLFAVPPPILLAHVVVLCCLGNFSGWCKFKWTFKVMGCFQSVLWDYVHTRASKTMSLPNLSGISSGSIRSQLQLFGPLGQCFHSVLFLWAWTPILGNVWLVSWHDSCPCWRNFLPLQAGLMLWMCDIGYMEGFQSGTIKAACMKSRKAQ